MSLSDSAVSTNGAGVIPATTMIATGSVTSCADWASCAAMYSSYRVRAIRVIALPAFVANTTAVTVPALIYVVPYYGGVIPSTISGFADTSGAIAVSGYKSMKKSVDFLTLNLDADSHLWTPTNTSITASEQFGIACMGTTTASTVSTLVWKTTYWFEVEFKIMG